MSVIITEGFDGYGTGKYVGKWQSQGGTIGAWGRNGTNGLKHTTVSNMGVGISNKQTLIVGMALKLSTGKFWTFVELRDGATNQLSLITDSSLQLQVKRGSSIIENTGFFLPTNQWFYLEFKVKIANAPDGEYEIRYNTNTVISKQTGVDTMASSNPLCNRVLFSMGGIGVSTHYLDDVYVFDDETAFCNDFAGDVHVETLFPDGVGYITQWIPQPGGVDNYENVDEASPDDDTTFVVTSGLGYMDSYEFTSMIATSGTIYCVQAQLWGKKDDVGARSLDAIIRPTTVTYSGGGTPESLGETYGYSLFNWTINPQSMAHWTIADINETEFGIKQAV